MPVPAPVITTVRGSVTGVLRVVEHLAIGTDREVRQRVERRPGIAEDLAVAAVLLQVNMKYRTRVAIRFTGLDDI